MPALFEKEDESKRYPAETDYTKMIKLERMIVIGLQYIIGTDFFG